MYSQSIDTVSAISFFFFFSWHEFSEVFIPDDAREGEMLGSQVSVSVSVQLLSHVQLFATPWTAARQASLSITNSRSLPKVMSIESAIQPSHPLSFPSPPAFNLSQHQGLFKWVSSSHEVAKILEFQLQHLSFQWTPRTDPL